MLRRLFAAIPIITLTILSACNGGSDSGTDEPSVALDPFPLSVGSTWQYDVTYRGVTATQAAVSITGTKMVDGTKVYVLGAGDIEYANYVRTGSEILALPPSNADAYSRAIGSRVILKLPLRPGEKWVQVDKTAPGAFGITSEYTVVTVQAPEDVVTPAGYFKGAYPVHTNTIYTIFSFAPGTDLVSYFNKIEWIALGVGVVARNTETLNPTVFVSGRSEQLASYSIVKN